jgi:hypothetical protein
MTRKVLLRTLVTLEVVLGLTALEGGWVLARHPDGSSFHLPPSLLAGTPFQDYAWPGVLLFVSNGLLPIAVALLTTLKRPWGRWIHLLPGIFFLGWMAAQLAFIGYRMPIQAVFVVWALVMLGLGIAVALEPLPRDAPRLV